MRFGAVDQKAASRLRSRHHALCALEVLRRACHERRFDDHALDQAVPGEPGHVALSEQAPVRDRTSCAQVTPALIGR
jgi:hypothetical protein